MQFSDEPVGDYYTDCIKLYEPGPILFVVGACLFFTIRLALDVKAIIS